MGHSNIKPFKCAVEGCGWAFTTAFKLKRHMNSHEKLKTAVCTKPGCGKEFSDVYNLKKHMLLHERELVYTCKDCGAECDTQPEYVKHLKVHKEQFKLYQELEAARGKAVTVQQEDLKDETTRGTVPIFNISNHRERQQFLSKVSTVGNGSVG